MPGSMSSKPGPFERLSAVEPSSLARSSSPESSQSSTTGRPSRASRFHGWMSRWVSTTGPGRSQVSTKWAIARNVSTWDASSSAHGCPVAAARSASSASPAASGPRSTRRSTRRRARGCARGSRRSGTRTPPTPVLRAASLPRPIGGRACRGCRDRLWHRDAGGEGRPLEPEHVLDAVSPAAVDEVQLLHRERPLVGVEPVHPVGEPAMDADHRPDRGAEIEKRSPQAISRNAA